ncbi:hypothetical protein RYX36_004971 [Vicia faba]
MPETDGSFEFGDDSPLSPAPNLFQGEATIPRRKRSTFSRKPRRYPRWRIDQSNVKVAVMVTVQKKAKQKLQVTSLPSETASYKPALKKTKRQACFTSYLDPV